MSPSNETKGIQYTSLSVNGGDHIPVMVCQDLGHADQLEVQLYDTEVAPRHVSMKDKDRFATIYLADHTMKADVAGALNTFLWLDVVGDYIYVSPAGKHSTDENNQPSVDDDSSAYGAGGYGPPYPFEIQRLVDVDIRKTDLGEVRWWAKLDVRYEGPRPGEGEKVVIQ